MIGISLHACTYLSVVLIDLLDGRSEREGPITSGCRIGANSEIPTPEQ